MNEKLKMIEGALPGTLSAHIADARKRLSPKGKWFQCKEVEGGGPALIGMDLEEFGFELCAECGLRFCERAFDIAALIQNTLTGHLPIGLWRGMTNKGGEQ